MRLVTVKVTLYNIPWTDKYSGAKLLVIHKKWGLTMTIELGLLLGIEFLINPCLGLAQYSVNAPWARN